MMREYYITDREEYEIALFLKWNRAYMELGKTVIGV